MTENPGETKSVTVYGSEQLVDAIMNAGGYFSGFVGKREISTDSLREAMRKLHDAQSSYSLSAGHWLDKAELAGAQLIIVML